MTTDTPAPRIPIGDLVRYYLRLGLLGFGGPVALVGQMEREMVGERKWLTKEEMREGIAVCQSLPGPLAILVPRSAVPAGEADASAAAALPLGHRFSSALPVLVSEPQSAGQGFFAPDV
jgi:hypothetical protein